MPIGAAPRHTERSAAMTNRHLSRDITSITLFVLFIGVLMGASFWILRPFLLALIRATMIVVAT